MGFGPIRGGVLHLFSITSRTSTFGKFPAWSHKMECFCCYRLSNNNVGGIQTLWDLALSLACSMQKVWRKQPVLHSKIPKLCHVYTLRSEKARFVSHFGERWSHTNPGGLAKKLPFHSAKRWGFGQPCLGQNPTERAVATSNRTRFTSIVPFLVFCSKTHFLFRT